MWGLCRTMSVSMGLDLFSCHRVSGPVIFTVAFFYINSVLSTIDLVCVLVAHVRSLSRGATVQLQRNAIRRWLVGFLITCIDGPPRWRRASVLQSRDHVLLARKQFGIALVEYLPCPFLKRKVNQHTWMQHLPLAHEQDPGVYFKNHTRPPSP
jgi:hypothetical protein